MSSIGGQFFYGIACPFSKSMRFKIVVAPQLHSKQEFLGAMLKVGAYNTPLYLLAVKEVSHSHNDSF